MGEALVLGRDKSVFESNIEFYIKKLLSDLDLNVLCCMADVKPGGSSSLIKVKTL